MRKHYKNQTKIFDRLDQSQYVRHAARRRSKRGKLYAFECWAQIKTNHFVYKVRADVLVVWLTPQEKTWVQLMFPGARLTQIQESKVPTRELLDRIVGCRELEQRVEFELERIEGYTA